MISAESLPIVQDTLCIQDQPRTASSGADFSPEELEIMTRALRNEFDQDINVHAAQELVDLMQKLDTTKADEMRGDLDGFRYF